MQCFLILSYALNTMTISKQNTIDINYFVFVETLVNEKWLLMVDLHSPRSARQQTSPWIDKSLHLGSVF